MNEQVWPCWLLPIQEPDAWTPRENTQTASGSLTTQHTGLWAEWPSRWQSGTARASLLYQELANNTLISLPTPTPPRAPELDAECH